MTRQQELIMARYSMTTSITGDHTPINWSTREINLGITYHNGIITITEPGYYKITAACYSKDRDPNYISCETQLVTHM